MSRANFSWPVFVVWSCDFWFSGPITHRKNWMVVVQIRAWPSKVSFWWDFDCLSWCTLLPSCQYGTAAFANAQWLKGSWFMAKNQSPSLIVILSKSAKFVEVLMGWEWWCQQSFCFQKFVDNAQQFFALLPQVNFPAHNLNFRWWWRWWDQIKATFYSFPL